MNNKTETYKRENIAPIEATNEGRISGTQLAEEIEPILHDYFYGNIERQGGIIKMTLPNGQSFNLTVRER